METITLPLVCPYDLWAGDYFDYKGINTVVAVRQVLIIPSCSGGGGGRGENMRECSNYKTYVVITDTNRKWYVEVSEYCCWWVQRTGSHSIHRNQYMVFTKEKTFFRINRKWLLDCVMRTACGGFIKMACARFSETVYCMIFSYQWLKGLQSPRNDSLGFQHQLFLEFLDEWLLVREHRVEGSLKTSLGLFSAAGLWRGNAIGKRQLWTYREI